MKKAPSARKVEVSNRHRALQLKAAQVRRLFETLEGWGGALPPAGALSVAFVGEAEIRALHARFLNDPSPTDVITFPAYDSECGGEICVCADTAARYAAQKDLNFAQELALYLVHGWLHLAGFDDHSPADRRQMRRAEKIALCHLKQAGALPGFSMKNRGAKGERRPAAKRG